MPARRVPDPASERGADPRAARGRVRDVRSAAGRRVEATAEARHGLRHARTHGGERASSRRGSRTRPRDEGGLPRRIYEPTAFGRRVLKRLRARRRAPDAGARAMTRPGTRLRSLARRVCRSVDDGAADRSGDRGSAVRARRRGASRPRVARALGSHRERHRVLQGRGPGGLRRGQPWRAGDCRRAIGRDAGHGTGDLRPCWPARPPRSTPAGTWCGWSSISCRKRSRSACRSAWRWGCSSGFAVKARTPSTRRTALWLMRLASAAGRRQHRLDHAGGEHRVPERRRRSRDVARRQRADVRRARPARIPGKSTPRSTVRCRWRSG